MALCVGDGLLVRGRGQPPVLWENVAGELQAWFPASATTWGGFDANRYLAGRGLLWEGKLSGDVQAPRHDVLYAIASTFLAPFRAYLLERLSQGLPRREATVAAAVLLGQRDTAGKVLRQPFTQLGLAHLFAVSGLHVGIILAIVLLVLRPVAPGPIARILGVFLFLVVYVLLTGMPSSVLRAAGLALLLTIAPAVGRRYDTLHALGVLFWVSCQLTPWCVMDTGTRLSYLAVAGIVILHRLAGPLLPSRPAVLRWFMAGLLVTIGAQWFTLPEIAASFGWIHPLAPLANLVAVPLFTLAVWLVVCGLACGPLLSAVADSLLAMGWLTLRLLEAGAAWLAANLPPGMGVPPFGPWRLSMFLGFSGALVVWLRAVAQSRVAGRHRGRWPIRSAGIFLVVGLVCLLPAGRVLAPGLVTAVQFDVGQGDCALLCLPDGWTVLIDTGVAWSGGSAWERSVWPWLRRQGLHRLDAVVLTHGHDDHDGAATAVANELEIGRWWIGGAAQPAARGEVVERPWQGDLLHSCGVWQLICLYPPAELAEELAENDRSLVLALLHGEEIIVLWSGDLELAGEAIMLAHPLPIAHNSTVVWKAGHHGSATSGGRALLDWVKPALVVVSCGVANHHGHPSHGPYVVRNDSVPMLRTDLDGSVLLQWDHHAALTWRTARGRHGVIAPR